VIRVAQFPWLTRVLPQLKSGESAVLTKYWLSVQECAMYSDAIQMVFPSTAVAP